MTDSDTPRKDERVAADGLFLAFEGVEGSGKSTQARLLADHLVTNGFEVVHAREPGSTPLGERVRSLVLDESGLGIPPRSELFLMLAARAAFVEQVVLPALRSGKMVIADRFELSTLAYQGEGRQLPVQEVGRCNRFATDGLTADATILLDLPTEEGVRRQLAAGKVPDRMEAEARDFHERVARGYDVLADTVANLIRIPAVGSVEEVHGRIMDVLRERYPETFPRRGVMI